MSRKGDCWDNVLALTIIYRQLPTLIRDVRPALRHRLPRVCGAIKGKLASLVAYGDP